MGARHSIETMRGEKNGNREGVDRSRIKNTAKNVAMHRLGGGGEADLGGKREGKKAG